MSVWAVLLQQEANMTKTPRKTSIRTSVVSIQQSNINLNDVYSELIQAYIDLQRTTADQYTNDYHSAEEETTNGKELQQTTR